MESRPCPFRDQGRLRQAMNVNRLKYKKLTNTRDLGGMRTADGRTIKSGKLIRSGKLSKIPPKTVLALREAGVTTIVDLRIENERSASPDVEIEGSRYIHLPILCVPTMGITSDYHLFETIEKESARVKKEGDRIKREFGSIDNYMKETYRSILFQPESRAGLRKFLDLVLEEEGCILWHCASGKDRAGICAMLIEALLGVPEDAIYEDYMLSGKYWRKRYLLNKTVLAVGPVSLRLKRILFGFMRIRREYLECIITEMKEKYGSIIGYAKSCLQVTDREIEILRDKYLQ